ncbi:organic cation transporter-like protein [Mizuhopecten yessoensis]|uniref:organic cation transporter-like protein n=1 Tax=Mizuhopecten yessoensis TaxID=6573 RepID=UPI000B45B58A|nr:organic cation transporter-like protein [Mizuhopecten yessoensis]
MDGTEQPSSVYPKMATCLVVDDLWQVLRPCGRYQLVQVPAILLGFLPVAYGMLIHVFIGYTPDFQCRNLSKPLTEYGINLSSNESTYNIMYGQCQITIQENGTIGQQTELPCPNGHHFSTQQTQSTIVTEWDLVCDKQGLGELSQTLVMVGQIVGAVFLSPLPDRYGRKPVMHFLLVSLYILSMNSLRGINLSLLQCLNTTVPVMCLELFSTEYRGFAGVITNTMWSTSVISLTLFGYFLKDLSWRYIQLISALSCVLGLFSFWTLDESLRWLVANNRRAEAMALVRKVAKRNNVSEAKAVYLLEKILERFTITIESTQTGRTQDKDLTVMSSMTATNDPIDVLAPLTENERSQFEMQTHETVGNEDNENSLLGIPEREHMRECERTIKEKFDQTITEREDLLKAKEQRDKEEHISYLDVFRNRKLLRNTLVLSLCWWVVMQYISVNTNRLTSTISFIICTKVTKKSITSQYGHNYVLVFIMSKIICNETTIPPCAQEKYLQCNNISTCIILYRTLDESLRWLVANNRRAEAMALVRKVAKRNNVSKVKAVYLLEKILERFTITIESTQTGRTQDKDLTVMSSMTDTNDPIDVLAPLTENERSQFEMQTQETVGNEDNANSLLGIPEREHMRECERTIKEKCDQTTTEREDLLKAKEQRDKEEHISYLDVFRNRKLLRNTLVLSLCWFSSSFGYMGLFLVPFSFTHNININFFINAIVEFPGLLIMLLLINRIGRRWLTMAYFGLAGVAIVVAVSILLLNSKSNETTQTMGAVGIYIGKFSISGVVAMLYIYTPELFPTNVRNIGYGITGCAGRLGAMTAPFLNVLASAAEWAPAAALSATFVLALCSLLLLPETKGKELPQTLHEFVLMEGNDKKSKLCNPCTCAHSCLCC